MSDKNVYYIGAENLFYKPGHPYYEDKNEKVGLIFMGFKAFGRTPNTDDFKLLDSQDFVYGYDSINGYEFQASKNEIPTFNTVECTTEQEAVQLYNRTIVPMFRDKKLLGPMALFYGDIYTFTLDDKGNRHISTILRKWVNQ